MLDYLTLRAQLMPIHGVFGLLAIVAGVAALAVPKAAPLHPRAGRGFLICMAIALAIAVPVIIAGRNLFLTGVGLLVIYHALTAWRLARLRPPARLPTPLDRNIHIASAIVFVIFALYGVVVLFAGAMMGVVAIVLAGISLASVHHFSRFMSQAEFEPGEWIGEHIRGMAAAFIASITAFATAAMPRWAPAIPEAVLWLAPSVILTPLFVWFGNRVQQDRARAKQAAAEAG